MSQPRPDGSPIERGSRKFASVLDVRQPDEAEFGHPDEFNPAREGNRHIAFGADPHRCIGSNLARMNLRVALTEIARRPRDVKLRPGAEIG